MVRASGSRVAEFSIAENSDTARSRSRNKKVSRIQRSVIVLRWYNQVENDETSSYSLVADLRGPDSSRGPSTSSTSNYIVSIVVIIAVDRCQWCNSIGADSKEAH